MYKPTEHPSANVDNIQRQGWSVKELILSAAENKCFSS